MIIFNIICLNIISLSLLVITFILNRKKPLHERFINWGIVLAFVFSVVATMAVGGIFIMLAGSGVAIVYALYLFPPIFMIGIILLIVGIILKFKQRK